MLLEWRKIGGLLNRISALAQTARGADTSEIRAFRTIIFVDELKGDSST
jgi:hypothetical protein